jgi:hypothetical protein
MPRNGKREGDGREGAKLRETSKAADKIRADPIYVQTLSDKPLRQMKPVFFN